MKFEELLEEYLTDEKFKEEWDKLEVEYAIKSAIIKARIERRMTQKELAEKSGIDRADISKMETGNCNPTIKKLQKLALGMGKKLVVNFVPLGK
jgi:Predicted transcriptional regulator with C-terminal CBS domains